MIDVLNLMALGAVYFPLCLGIVVACICRINLMTASRNKFAWSLMYVLMAAYAMGELTDVLVSMQWQATHELLGLLAIAFNLGMTHRHWRAGPPPITCKGCP